MKTKPIVTLLATIILLASAARAFDGKPDRSADEKAIRAHIDSIFQAYIRKDRDKVKATHSENWRGFLSNSKAIIRGIDGYMATADGQGMFNKQNPWRLVGYKFVDFDLVFYGETGVVNYVAELFWEMEDRKGSYKLRSMDIYAKEKGEWNQVASNIGPLPEENQHQWSSTFRILSNDEHKRLTKAREEVWYAFFANDTAKLQRLIPKETVAINPGNPKFDDQAAIFAAAKAQAGAGAKLTRLEFSNTMIQVYGSTVIMYSNYVLDLDVKGVKETNSGRATEIFVIKGDTIENVGWHLDLVNPR